MVQIVFLRAFCTFFALRIGNQISRTSPKVGSRDRFGPVRVMGALRSNSHLTNPNQFEHVALKPRSQLSRRVESKNNSKLQKNGVKMKSTHRDLRYAPRIQLRTRGGAEIKGTMDSMDGSGTGRHHPV